MPKTLDIQPDELLMGMVAAGDKDALAMMFRRYAALVLNIARRTLRRSAEADQIVQDVFTFLFRKAALFNACNGSMRSRILQVTFYRALHRRRYLDIRGFHTHRDPGDVILTGLECEAEEHFIAECLKRAWCLDSATQLWQVLSSSQMLTMELHLFQGQTPEEISRCHGQTLRDVRHHYYRGLEKLRRAQVLCRIGSERTSRDRKQQVPLLESQHADDYFLELCALWSTGTLSAAEWHQLSVHLSLCSSCKAIKAQYDRMLVTLIPALASWLSSVDDEGTESLSSIEKVRDVLFRSL